jgi:SAM-dependent methyltransferase
MNNVINWTNNQINFMISQWDKAIATNYPQYRKEWEEPKEHYKCIHEKWNYLDAIQIIPWDNYLNRKNLIIVELGAGTGWLSAYLSKLDKISKIYAIDSSSFFINKMMPDIIDMMNGKKEKITPIEGLFTPILLDDNSIDIVVMCSALHHANDLETVLKEIYRIIKPTGHLFILNETPLRYFEYIIYQIKIFIKIILHSYKKKYLSISQSISSSGILYDPALGDRIYPLWFWIKAINNSGFKSDIIKTKYKTYKKKNNNGKGRVLFHFICKK